MYLCAKRCQLSIPLPPHDGRKLFKEAGILDGIFLSSPSSSRMYFLNFSCGGNCEDAILYHENEVKCCSDVYDLSSKVPLRKILSITLQEFPNDL